MIKMLEIQTWVDVVCESNVYQSFRTDSELNTANAQVYVECKNAPISAKNRKQNLLGKWRRHDKNARDSSVSDFSIYVSFHNVSLTGSISTSITAFYTPNPTLRRPPTTDWFFFVAKLLETRNRHPGVQTLVLSNWSLDWLLIGCRSVQFVCSNHIVSIILVVLCFHPGVPSLIISDCQFY